MGSMVLATFVMLPSEILLLYIHRKSNKSRLNSWLEEEIGKVGSFIFLDTIILFFCCSLLSR